MAALDVSYTRQRLALMNKVAEQAQKLWDGRDFSKDDSFLIPVQPIIEGGMRAVVQLQNGYFSQKARLFTGDHSIPMATVNPKEYTVQAIRGISAREVYSRPFGKLYAQIGLGVKWEDANQAASAYVLKLAKTDMSLALTHSAQGWIRKHG